MQTPKLERGEEGLDGKDILSRDWCVCVLSGGRDTGTQVCVLVKKKKKGPALNTAGEWEVSLSVGRTLIFWKMSKKCSLQSESLLFGNAVFV